MKGKEKTDKTDKKKKKLKQQESIRIKQILLME